MWLLIHVTLLMSVTIINALPTNVAKSTSERIILNGNDPFPGLGGLGVENLGDGGVHAEAGTPSGQSEEAGVGGAVDATGTTSDAGAAASRVIEKRVAVPAAVGVETFPQTITYVHGPHLHSCVYYKNIGFGGFGGAGGDYGSYTVTVTKTANPRSFTDFFSIPNPAIGPPALDLS